MSFAVHTWAFLLNLYLGVEWLDHRVCVWSALGDIAGFPKWLYQFILPLGSVQKFQFLYILTSTLDFTDT